MFNDDGPEAAYEVLRAFLYGATGEEKLEAAEEKVLAANGANPG